MQFWRTITIVCVALLLVSVQCRAKCLVMPEPTQQSAHTHHPPGCPMHKQQVPDGSKHCVHAPQWDVDETGKQIVALIPEPVLLPVLLTSLLPKATAVPVEAPPRHVQTHLRI